MRSPLPMAVFRKSHGFAAAVAVIAASLLAPGARAQRVSFGVVAGGYANRDFRSFYIPRPGFPPDVAESDSGGYVAGASVVVRLFPQLSLGFDALYKPLHYRRAATYDQRGMESGFAPATVLTWQFPILAKYNFTNGRVAPFLEAGPSFRATGNLNVSNPSRLGVTAGVGAETPWWKFRVAPRVRYT